MQPQRRHVQHSDLCSKISLVNPSNLKIYCKTGSFLGGGEEDRVEVAFLLKVLGKFFRNFKLILVN